MRDFKFDLSLKRAEFSKFPQKLVLALYLSGISSAPACPA
jgi:hypothetical protein